MISNICKTGNNAQNLQRLIAYRKSLETNRNVIYQVSQIIKERIKQFFIEGHEKFAFCIPFNLLEPSWTGPNWENCIEYELSKEELGKMIEGYIQQIKDVIYNEQIRLYQSEWKPKCLFITGKFGAMLSNLEIKSYIEEVYGVKVYFDICPETSISKGLASTKIIRCDNK